MELLDELYSGVPSVGAAEIQAGFAASYSVTALALLFVPGLVAMFVEPALFVLSDRHPRKWFVCGGLLAMGLAAWGAAWAPNVHALSAALTLAYLGSGCGVALAQATLVDARPREAARILTRWTLLGEIGDLLAPALMAWLAHVQSSWRTAYAWMGALFMVWASLLLAGRFPDPERGEAAPEEDEPGVFAALREAFAHRRLVGWLGAAALCELLDEIVVVFGALFLRDRLALDPAARSFVLGSGIVGAIVGVLATDRLLGRIPPLRLLLAAGGSCCVAYVGWLLTSSMWSSALAFFLVGATAAPMYPIASAQAYAALPGRSGTVNAAAHVFTPVVLALPWLLGLVGDRFGILVALAFLGVQPLGIVVVACIALRDEARTAVGVPASPGKPGECGSGAGEASHRGRTR